MTNKEQFRVLMKPLKVGNVTLPNRLGTPPMGTFAEDATGLLTHGQVEYYAARAKGGMGLVTVEGQLVTDKLNEGTAGKTLVDTEAQMKQWALVAESVHAYGAKASIQLTPGIGRMQGVGPDGSLPPAPSAVPTPNDPSVMCRALSNQEVHDIVAAFGRCTERAVRAGFDMVQVNAHAGFMIDQFMTELWNKRTDEYGGSFEGRMRIVDEIYDAMRAAAGPGVALGFRMAAWHVLPGGRTRDEGQKIAKHMEDLGFDFLDIDIGCGDYPDFDNPSYYVQDGTYIEGAKAIKDVVSIPVMCSGSQTPETAVRTIESGSADVVLLGRPSIAEPEFAVKLLEGRREDVRPCLACNEYCIGRIYKGLQVACAVNAQSGRETDFAITPAARPRNVLVVGGGPAGMEAARVAALRGHHVTLCEAGPMLGGGLLATAAPRFKGRYKAFLDWQKRQLDETGVQVCLNKEVTLGSADLDWADKIVVAMGSKPIAANTDPDAVNTVSAYMSMLDPSLVTGDKVVVLGGMQAACDIALEFAMAGKSVTIVEEGPVVPSNLILAPNVSALNHLFEEYKVERVTNATNPRITKNGVAYEGDDGNAEIQADTVISALGWVRNDAADAILEEYPGSRAIGDCDEIGKVGEAVRSGFFAGWSI